MDHKPQRQSLDGRAQRYSRQAAARKRKADNVKPFPGDVLRLNVRRAPIDTIRITITEKDTGRMHGACVFRGRTSGCQCLMLVWTNGSVMLFYDLPDGTEVNAVSHLAEATVLQNGPRPVQDLEAAAS